MATFEERKFKIGDKVRILKYKDGMFDKRFPIYSVGIVNFISLVSIDKPYKIIIDNDFYWYDEDELELVEDVNDDSISNKDTTHKFKVGDKVIVGDSIIGKITDINVMNYTYKVTLYTNDIGWFNENELKLFNDVESVRYCCDLSEYGNICNNVNPCVKEKVEMKERKFKVDDKVRTLVVKDVNGNIRFPKGTIGWISVIDTTDQLTIMVNTDDNFWWYDDNELELVQSAEVGPVPVHNKICSDVARDVTVEELEKLEEELRRKDSELRDLKELIIKLLFDRYGY